MVLSATEKGKMETSVLATTEGSANDLVTLMPTALDRYPVAVYLASLAGGSRCTLREALNAIGALLT